MFSVDCDEQGVRLENRLVLRVDDSAPPLRLQRPQSNHAAGCREAP